MRRDGGYIRMDITSSVKLLEESDVDLLREGVRVLAQEVMETEVSGQIGASPHDRSSERTRIATAIARGPGTPGSHDRVEDPQGEHRGVFPPARTSPGRGRGLREGRLDQQGR